MNRAQTSGHISVQTTDGLRIFACKAPELTAVSKDARPDAADIPLEKRAALPTVTVSDRRRRPPKDPQFLINNDDLLIPASKR